MTTHDRLASPLLAALLMLALAPASARSQETPDDDAQPASVTLSPSVDALNTKGVSAIIEGDYEAAVVNLTSALAIQEGNILYLNLGRAYAKLGQCEQARVHYEKAATAPQVASPTPDEIAAILERYTAELEDCVETTVASDDPEDDALTAIDDPDGQDLDPDDDPQHADASNDGALEDTDATDDGHAGTPPGIQPPDRTLMFVGWATAGAGVAVLISAIAIDVAVLGPDIDAMRKAGREGDAETYASLKDDLEGEQGVTLGLYIGGGLLAATGVTLLIVDALIDEVPPDASTAASLTPWMWAGEASGGLGLEARF